jgi:hypothetical protein
MLTFEGVRVRIEDPSSFIIEVTSEGVTIRQWEIADAEPLPEVEGEADPEPEPPSAAQSRPARARVVFSPGPVPPIAGRPVEVIEMALAGIPPGRLCAEFSIAPITLRHILSGYGSYRRYRGSDKVWAAYYRQFKHDIDGIAKAGLTAVA